MDKIDVSELGADEVGWTLLATLYLRAWEARGHAPILGDRYAADALERLDFDEASLRRRTRPEVNQYLVGLRARTLDDWAGDFLRRHPDAVALQLGCGLDSRMLRLGPPPGVDWIDLDLPAVIAVRRRLYPERQRYRMVAASVTQSDWWSEVPTGRPVLVVAEGLLMYLHPGEVRRLLDRVAERVGSGELIFDGVAPWLARLGPTVHWGLRDSREVEAWNRRLRGVEQVSIGARWDRVSSRAVRTVYRFGAEIPGWRRIMQAFRFTIG